MFQHLAADPFGDAIGQPALNWTSSGDAPWTVVNDVSFEGGASVRSGKIGNRQTTTLSTTIIGPITVDFRWKVSSESGSDKLTFNAVDLESGVSPSRTISGEQDWQVVSVVLQARPYRLEWVYSKDGGFASGADAGWVDQLVFSAAPPSAPVAGSLSSASVAVGKLLTLVPTGLKGSPLSYQWYHDGAAIPNATNRTYAVTSAARSDAGLYQYVLSNQLGSSTSSVAVVNIYTAKRFATLASVPITNAIIRNVGFITSAGSSRRFAPQHRPRPAGIFDAPEPQRAFVESGNTLHILNLSDPTKPVELIPDDGTGVGRPVYFGGFHYQADGPAGISFQTDHNPPDGVIPPVTQGHVSVPGGVRDVRWVHAADGEYLLAEADTGIYLFRANAAQRILPGDAPVSVFSDTRLGSSLPSAFESANDQVVWGTATGGFLMGISGGGLSITATTPKRVSPSPFVGPAALGTLGGPGGRYLASMGVGWLSVHPEGSDGVLNPASVIPISDTILQSFGETSIAADSGTVIVSGYRGKTAAFDVSGAVNIGKQSAILFHDFIKPGDESATTPSFVDYSEPLGILGVGNTVTIFTMVARGGPPTINRQPADITLNPGETGTLSVGATGDGTLKYQWHLKIESIGGYFLLVGETANQLKVSAPPGDHSTYRVVVSNEYSSTESRDVVVTLRKPAGPSITRQPVGGVVDGFEHFFHPLSVEATAGTGSLSFQWYRVVEKPGGLTEATSIPGATGPEYLAITSGHYFVRVTDSSGAQVDSADASVVFVGGCIRFAKPYQLKCADAVSTSVTLLRTPANDQLSLDYAEDVVVTVDAAFLGLDLPHQHTSVTAHFAAGATQTSFVLGSEIPPGAVAKLEILSGPGRARLCSGNGELAMIAIRNCKSIVEFSDHSVDINENDSHHRVHVAVERSGDLSQAVSVKYRTLLSAAGPNAASSSDLIESVGTLFFAPNQEEGVITVGITDDSLPEETETFVIELFDPNGTQIGTNGRVEVAIHDDDWPIVETSVPTTVKEKDCIEVPTSIQVAWTDGIVVLPYRRLAIPEATSDTEIAVLVAPLEAAAGEMPPGVVAAVEGIDFVLLGSPLKFPASASQETERDVVLLLRRGIAETNVIRRIKLVGDFSAGAIACGEEVTFVDLVSPATSPAKVTAQVEPGGDGSKIRIDSDTPGYPRVARELGGAFEPLNPPVLPLRVDVGRQAPVTSGFVAWYPIPLVPGIGGPDQPPIPGRRVDFGDAPASYEVLPLFGPAMAGQPSWPASHVIDPGLHLGARIDGEAANQPGFFADGDDTHGLPDDDGVVFRRPLVAGMVAEVVVTSSRAGFLDAWIDYGRDGSFLPTIPGLAEDSLAPALLPALAAGGAAPGSIPLVPGANTLRFLVPGGASPGRTYARFRLSSRGGLSPLFPAPDGEVEDYAVFLFGAIADFGDAPDDGIDFRYPTRLDHGGAFHLATIPQFYLGAGVDFESDGHPDTDALGDDKNTGANAGQVSNGRDEDGLVSFTGLAPGKTSTLTVAATIKTVPDGKLDAWIDWNRDGDWDDAGEHILSAARIVDGTNSYTISVPAGARIGKTYLRLRLTRTGISTSGGPANEGEVEDHAVVIGP